MLATRNKAIEKAKWDEQSCLRGAKEEGELEKAFETAKNLLKLALEMQQVMAGTGLGLDEIERLKKELLMS